MVRRSELSGAGRRAPDRERARTDVEVWRRGCEKRTLTGESILSVIALYFWVLSTSCADGVPVCGIPGCDDWACEACAFGASPFADRRMMEAAAIFRTAVRESLSSEASLSIELWLPRSPKALAAAARTIALLSPRAHSSSVSAYGSGSFAR